MPPRNLSELLERLHVKFIGGCLCLDFVNTVGGRAGGAVIRDKLGSYQDLLDWSLLAGSADRGAARTLARRARRHSAEAAAVLHRAIRLREALYRIFLRSRSGRRPAQPDAAILRAELTNARGQQQFALSRGGFAWTFPPRTEALDRILWPLALSAAQLLTSPDLARLGQCAGPVCGWLFLDTSRNRRRRWCDMQDCGNRAKVRRFRTKAGNPGEAASVDPSARLR
ncbi:MAG TPA: CGNR zinc finger domain-containing protein [Bryobacteraceae bacterium]|nr:CGNR zinc finger domain-containing protein [Bryobacteraceae bacterium]